MGGRLGTPSLSPICFHSFRKDDMITNRDFVSDPIFRLACEMAKTTPTRRQASKFRMQRGLAFQYKRAAIRKLEAKK